TFDGERGHGVAGGPAVGNGKDRLDVDPVAFGKSAPGPFDDLGGIDQRSVHVEQERLGRQRRITHARTHSLTFTILLPAFGPSRCRLAATPGHRRGSSSPVRGNAGDRSLHRFVQHRIDGVVTTVERGRGVFGGPDSSPSPSPGPSLRVTPTTTA